MIDFNRLLYGASFTTFGTPASLVIGDAVPVLITVIDRTSGVKIEDGQIGIMSVQPGADIRAADLAGVDLADLDGASLTFNGTTWRIHTVLENPTPSGAADGLVTVTLIGP